MTRGLLTLAVLAGCQPTVRVAIVAGQSNAQGQADEWDTSEPALLEPVAIPYWYDMPPDGARGIVHTSTTLEPLRSRGDDRFGPELTLGRDLAALALPGDTSAVLKVAFGNTSLAVDWAPDGPRWERFVAAWLGMRAAIEAEYPGQPISADVLLWVQGESDALLGFGAEYGENLRAFVERVRALTSPGLHVIVVGLHDGSPFGSPTERALVRVGQLDVANIDARVTYLDPNRLEMSSGPNPPNGHYTADALLELGRLSAMAHRDRE